MRPTYTMPLLLCLTLGCQPDAPAPTPHAAAPPSGGTTAQAAEPSAPPEVVEVTLDAVDPAHEGKLVYLTGPAATERFTDEATGVSVEGIVWRRDVEMYQRNETRTRITKKSPGGKREVKVTYEYAFVWRAGRVDTDGFRDPAERGKNATPEMKIDSKGGGAQLRIGAYTVPDVTKRMLEMEPVDPSTQELVDGVVVDEGWIYLGGDPKAPKLGDLRVRYTAIPAGTFSVIGRQSNGEVQLAAEPTARGEASTGALARGEVPMETLRARIGTQRLDMPLSKQ